MKRLTAFVLVYKMKHPKSFDSTPETRERMANVKLKNGTAEQLLAKQLWHLGYRYRKNYKKLPGSPDIALTRYRIAIFVDGEFWHGKDWPERKAKLQRNREYWVEKIEENIARDRRVDNQLQELGWLVIRFWEKEVFKDCKSCVSRIISAFEE